MALSLLGLTLLAVFLYWNGAREGMDAVDKNLFKVGDLSKIDQVILQSGNKKVELSYTGSKWKVNETYDADEQMITVLFATLDQAEPKRPVASGLSDSISAVLKTKGVHVKLLEQGQLINELEVGGNSQKTQAFFQHTGGEPYVMVIPGYRVYVAGIFELEEQGWKEKRIFNFNWRNFKKLSASFTRDPRQNFDIEDQGDGFALVGATRTDTTKLNDYLDAVSLLMAKQYISPGFSPAYDSLLQVASPSVQISVFDVGNNAHKLELYEPLQADPNVLGRKDGNELVIFDREQVIPIVKTRDSFGVKQP